MFQGPVGARLINVLVSDKPQISVRPTRVPSRTQSRPRYHTLPADAVMNAKAGSVSCDRGLNRSVTANSTNSKGLWRATAWRAAMPKYSVEVKVDCKIDIAAIARAIVILILFLI